MRVFLFLCVYLVWFWFIGAEWRIYASSNKSSFVRVIACRLFAAKPLFEPSVVICYWSPGYRTDVDDNGIEILIFSFTKMWSAKWWPFSLRLSVLSRHSFALHYTDVKMNGMESQIASLTIVYSTVHSGTDQRKHHSSASLAFGEVAGDRWIPRTKGP